jgi:Flp pilus assembly protein TadD
MQRSVVSALLILGSSIFSLASDSQLRSCHVQVSMSNGVIPARLKLQIFDRGKRIRDVRVPETGSLTLTDLAPGDYRIQTGGIEENFLTAGPLHVPADGPCDIGFTILGRTDSHNSLAEDDVDVEDLRVSAKAQSLFQSAFAQFARGELQKSRSSFIEVTKLAPRLSRTYNILGVISNQLGDTQSGRQYFEKALELNPHSKPALMNLAKLSMIERKFDAALAMLERYRIGSPDLADVHGMEAEAYLKLGRYNDAIREAKAAHSLPHPNWASIHVIAATSFEALHQTDNAVSEYRQFIQESNQQPLKERAAQRIGDLTSIAEQRRSQIPINSLVTR